MTRRILVVHPDLHVLAGDVRAMLMFADTFKMLGYDVLFLYTDIRPHKDRYFSLEQIYDYHTIKYLKVEPCKPLGIRLCGDFQEIQHKYLRPQVYDYLIKLEEFDTLFTDKVVISYFGDDDAKVNTILYVHYPDRPSAPFNIKIWVNSSYIANLVYDNWYRVSKVVYPPLHLDYYYPYRSFDDRDYDIVMFGQMYYTKKLFLAEKFANMGYRVAVIGAKIPNQLEIRSGKIDMYVNATVKEYTDILSRSKIYIHARAGEHFGITITEAMASGCPVIVHRSGGQWSDIVMYGAYGLGFYTFNELEEHVLRLLNDKEFWNKYHTLSIIRAKKFSTKEISKKIKRIL